MAKWKTGCARAALRKAFSERFASPDWVKNIRFLNGSHSGPHPLATIRCVMSDGGEGDAPIKVLPDMNAIKNFWNQYPGAEVVAVYVTEHDSPEQIRERVFAQIDRNR